MRSGEILELNTFLAVAREGRFARAAVELGVTPSAVSQSIRRLEARLDTRLFSRTTRSVALTEAGEALLLEVRPALDALAGAERVLTEGRPPSGGKARISVSAVAMELLIAPILAEFRQAHPAFHLDIVVEDRLTDAVARRYDAVIRRGDLLEQDMIARRISKDDRLILVASGTWLASHKLPPHPRGLTPHRIVIRRPRTGAILPWSLACREEAITMRGGASLVAESALAARHYAIAGLGVALLAHDFVAAMVGDGTLRWILRDWNSPLAGFHMMYAHRGTLPPALDDLLRRMAAADRSGSRHPDVERKACDRRGP